MSKITYNNDQYIEYFGDGISARYIPNYVAPTLQTQLLNFLPTLPFTRVTYSKFNKLRHTPRLTWCYGQINETASYRGKTFKTEAIPQWLMDLKRPIEQYCGVDFNAVLLNKYQDGSDFINWHVDDEKFLDHHIVASITIGAERDFQMRGTEKGTIHELKLKSGSLLIFNDALHSLPKRSNTNGVRFNITFRKVKDIGNYYYYNRGF
jgi:alkylated DNA repair dioxygenase AlkB